MLVCGRACPAKAGMFPAWCQRVALVAVGCEAVGANTKTWLLAIQK